MFEFLIAGGAAALLSAALAYMLIPIGRALKLVDAPFTATRKVHKEPIVLISGVAIAASVIGILLVASRVVPELVPLLSFQKWFAMIAAIVVIMVFGVFDDRFNLSPRIQIIGPILASLIICFSGIVVGNVTNPLGGVISFSNIPFVAGLITFCWLMGMMYSTKLLDGLDGLSTGLSGIGALMIFALTQTHRFFEPRIGFVAIVFAGACLGFLVLNFNPARAFLGEGGSLFVGLMLAILSVLSGSKIATALIVMGLPVIDVARVIISRKLRGHSIFVGDDQHLHHLLLANGLSHRSAVLFYYAVGLSFGVLALFLQSKGKIILLGFLVVLGVALAQWLRRRSKKSV
jgi:UDP-GlcNAc:undecaprenyl-phosphate GlcNAc-1-phosphate transferase